MQSSVDYFDPNGAGVSFNTYIGTYAARRYLPVRPRYNDPHIVDILSKPMGPG